MKRLLGLLAIVFILASCISDFVGTTLYQFDRANKAGKVTEDVPEPYQKIDLKDANGNRTVGWYYEYTDKNAPFVLYFHGNASNIKTAYDSGLFDNLKKLKVNFAIFDYPKYGLSTGEPSEKSVIDSAQVVYNLMKQKFPRSKFILWGRSLGCAPATIMAEKNQAGVSRLILTSPWNSFWKMIQYRSNWSEAECRKASIGNEYETEVHARNIKMPVLIHHGTADKVVPWEMGKELSGEFAGNDVTFVSLEGLDHDNLLVEKSWEEISQFIRY
jgi:alpha-beta hydrolase superfamily lysophospholipase